MQFLCMDKNLKLFFKKQNLNAGKSTATLNNVYFCFTSKSTCADLNLAWFRKSIKVNIINSYVIFVSAIIVFRNFCKFIEKDKQKYVDDISVWMIYPDPLL